MTTTLITGSNKGLGHEAARRLIAAGQDVWMTARDPEQGKQAADELGARFVQLDVTEDDSVRAAADTVAGQTGLDVLVNNAGITGVLAEVPDTTPENVRETFETNVFGVVRVVRAFTPLLDRSDAPVVVNVSSGLGSLDWTSDPERLESTFVNLSYSSSKSALNMLTSQWSKVYPGWRVNAVDPGYTATDLNGHSGTQSVQEGTDAIVEAASVAADGPTGTFFGREGARPW